MGDPVSLAILGAQAAGVVGGVLSERDQQSAQSEATASRLSQERLASAQRGLNRAQELNKVISTSESLAGARGAFGSSPSFAAIINKSFQAFEQDERADALNLSFREDFLKQQASASKSASEARIFGQIGSLGASAVGKDPFNLFGKRDK